MELLEEVTRFEDFGVFRSKLENSDKQGFENGKIQIGEKSLPFHIQLDKCVTSFQDELGKQAGITKIAFAQK